MWMAIFNRISFGRVLRPRCRRAAASFLAGVANEAVALLEEAGVSAAWIYAYQHTDGLLPRPDGTFNSEGDSAGWTGI